MPPPKSKEFISSDESEAESTDSEVESKKKVKKTKKTTKKVKEAEENEEPAKKKVKSDSSENKKEKKKVASKDGPSRNENDEPYWELTNSRRVTVSTFKGRKFVNIREYYEKDGQLLPGRKGISLPVGQWEGLCNIMNEINEHI